MGMGKEAMTNEGRKANASEARIRGLWIATLVVLLIGLLLSLELVRLHFEAVSNPARHSYCSVSSTVSCDAVTRSKYSVVFGVPLAMWGVFGYAAVALAAVRGLRRPSGAAVALLSTLTSFLLVVTVLLAAISHFLIHAWCLLCIGTYVVNVTAAVVSFFLLAQQGARASYSALLEQCVKERGRAVVIVGLSGSAALALMYLFPPAHASDAVLAPKSKASVAAPEGSAAATEPSVEPIPPLPPGARIEHGVTSDGLPWIGAENPVLTITEFFDYECSHCKLAFRGLHEVLALNPDRLRLVVRHFPLDRSCNRSMRSRVYEHSCSYAKLANCAGEQKRFWEAHEYLFDSSGSVVDPKTFAKDLKLNAKLLEACMGKDNEALSRDIEAGIALDLHGTPVFIVDGKLYMQQLPASIGDKLRRTADGR
jgi:protein-disulfide isomerase/uncharacterized membrane protein